jgi:hypothetical protein
MVHEIIEQREKIKSLTSQLAQAQEERGKVEGKYRRALYDCYCQYEAFGIESLDNSCVTCQYLKHNTREKQRECIDKFFSNDQLFKKSGELI